MLSMFGTKVHNVVTFERHCCPFLSTFHFSVNSVFLQYQINILFVMESNKNKTFIDPMVEKSLGIIVTDIAWEEAHACGIRHLLLVQ